MHRRIILASAWLAIAVSAAAATAEADRRPLYEAGLLLAEGLPREQGRRLLGSMAGNEAVPAELLAGLATGLAGSGRDEARESVLPASPMPADTDEGACLPTVSATDAHPDEAGANPVIALPGGLSAIGLESFWIALGDPTAPGVFLVADPTCPFSARAVASLAEEISSGRLHVRLVLAPVLSNSSHDLAASIMLDLSPADAAWSMMLGLARGDPPPDATGAAAALGEFGRALLDSNLDWMRRHQLSAVPHYVWSERGIWHQRSGLQQAQLFTSADTLETDNLSMHAPADDLALLGNPSGNADGQ